MNGCHHSRAVVRAGFTLVELLVVVAIIGLLLAVLLPSLSRARHQARTLVCLSNIRQMETAHWVYMRQYNDWFVDVGLSHGGAAGLDDDRSFIRTLEQAGGQALLRKSPLDNSVHWPVQQGGEGAVVNPDDPEQDWRYRQSSYGINNLLTWSTTPFDPGTGENMYFHTLSRIPRPSGTVHFLFMAKSGPFAGSDHTHVEGWAAPDNPALPPQFQVDPVKFTLNQASTQIQIDAVRGPQKWLTSVANYGFVDGHAESLEFQSVWHSKLSNKFWPDTSHYRNQRHADK